VALPKVTPRLVMIRKFRALGFDGPHPGSRHPFMRRGTLTVPIPNKHKGDEVRRGLLREILKQQAGISEQEWRSA
jgi:predicted RNA binding protein YcfA (HicA-like mRNA interferase family)